MTDTPYTLSDPLAPFDAALTAALDRLGEPATVGPEIPAIDDPDVAAGWPPTAPPHIQTALDGSTPIEPVAARHTYRLTTWAADHHEAMRVAELAVAAFVAGPAPGLAHRTRALDPTPALDDLSGAALATATVAATGRRTAHPYPQETNP